MAIVLTIPCCCSSLVCGFGGGFFFAGGDGQRYQTIPIKITAMVINPWMANPFSFSSISLNRVDGVCLIFFVAGIFVLFGSPHIGQEAAFFEISCPHISHFMSMFCLFSVIIPTQ